MKNKWKNINKDNIVWDKAKPESDVYLEETWNRETGFLIERKMNGVIQLIDKRSMPRINILDSVV